MLSAEESNFKKLQGDCELDKFQEWGLIYHINKYLVKCPWISTYQKYKILHFLNRI